MNKNRSMKVTAFIGSARKRHTYKISEQLLKTLQSLGDVEYEIVRLSDYTLKTCKGCKLCMDKGEEFCPLNDDRDILIEKMIHSDGVIFASPNYFFQVSALMKIFLDRLAFFGHRPKFFGKTWSCIVTQGVGGGGKIVKYLNFIGNMLGFNVVNGSFCRTLEPMTEKGQKKNNKKITKQSKRFYLKLIKNEYPTPTIFKLMMFRMARSSMKLMLNEEYRDYKYFLEQGWFDSDYYYPVKLGWLKKMAGRLFERIGTSMAK